MQQRGTQGCWHGLGLRCPCCSGNTSAGLRHALQAYKWFPEDLEYKSMLDQMPVDLETILSGANHGMVRGHAAIDAASRAYERLWTMRDVAYMRAVVQHYYNQHK